MAAGGPVTRLTEEATCPICLEYFNNPVTLPCGHNFCEACIARYWEELAIRATCPQCRQHFYRRSVKPNRQLANVVELVKELQEAKIVEGKAGLCDKHQEPLKLFCKDEEVPICTVCDKGKEHRSHLVIPIGEAAKEYQVKTMVGGGEIALLYSILFKKCLQPGGLEGTHRTSISCPQLTYAFLSLNKFLEEKDFSWQDYLEDLQREIKREEHKNFVILSEEISRLSRLITKIEDICPHPPSEYLEVRVHKCLPDLCPHWILAVKSHVFSLTAIEYTS
uniref:Uncharacterized protein n=1 Tax=Salvator merianae TaxID=96440 RepID=A0A8D0BRC4_SALMN